jgi:hypothetical protein
LGTPLIIKNIYILISGNVAAEMAALNVPQYGRSIVFTQLDLRL